MTKKYIIYVCVYWRRRCVVGWNAREHASVHFLRRCLAWFTDMGIHIASGILIVAIAILGLRIWSIRDLQSTGTNASIEKHKRTRKRIEFLFEITAILILDWSLLILWFRILDNDSTRFASNEVLQVTRYKIPHSRCIDGCINFLYHFSFFFFFFHVTSDPILGKSFESQGIWPFPSEMSTRSRTTRNAVTRRVKKIAFYRFFDYFSSDR